MIEHLLRRMASAVLVVWMAATLGFLALAVLPGDAITSQLTLSGVDSGVIAERRDALGLNRSLIERYLQFLFNLVRGNLGASLLSGEPVTGAILRTIQPTFTLAISALIVACLSGIGWGILTAVRVPLVAPLSRILMNLALSMPIYWTGTLAIYVFTVHLGISAAHWSRALLPIAVLGFHTAGSIGRVTQANIRDVLGSDFVRTARAKGLRERRVIVVHVLRAGLPPVVGVIALQTGFLLSGTMITETLFIRPGLGRLLLDAVVQQDYPIVLGVVVLSATIYMAVSILADVVLSTIDPRVIF